MSILHQLAESDISVTDDLDLNYTINEYIGIVNEAASSPFDEIKFSARDIHFVGDIRKGIAVCNVEDIERLCEAQSCEVDEALHMIQDTLKNDDGFDITLNTFGVCVKFEQGEKIMEAAKSGGKKVTDMKKGKIQKRINLLKRLKECGVVIFKS